MNHLSMFAPEFFRGPVPAPPSFDRVVMGIEAPIRPDRTCGIITVGALDRRAYVLADDSQVTSDSVIWASSASRMAAAYGVTAVYIETGGQDDLARALLGQAGMPCKVHCLNKRTGRHNLALPFAAAYEAGNVVHCGSFPALETELLDYETARRSTARAEALFWALVGAMA